MYMYILTVGGLKPQHLHPGPNPGEKRGGPRLSPYVPHLEMTNYMAPYAS